MPDNYAADRDAGERILRASLEVRAALRANRSFLGRVVRFLAGEAGISQFVDLGTGLPTAQNVHQVAQAMSPSARVVYVDNDHSKSGCVHYGIVALAAASID